MDITAALAVLAERGAASHEERCAFCVPDPAARREPEPAADPSEALVAEDAAATPLDLVRGVISAQERRVLEYRRFEEGFVCFLQVAEAEGYASLVADATAAFSAISKRVNAAAERLTAMAAEAGQDAAVCGVFAALVRRLQEHEREKLTVTAQLQIVRHGILVDELRVAAATSCNGDTDEEAEGAGGASSAERTLGFRREEEAELRAKLGRLAEAISEVTDEVRCELADM